MKRYPWKWDDESSLWMTLLVAGSDGVPCWMPRVPPDTARRALARRWLMSGEPVTGVLAWDRDMRKAVR